MMTSAGLVAVGDISFGDNAVSASFGVETLLRTTPDLDVFRHVHYVLRDHDIVFGNLETVLSDEALELTNLRSRHMRGRPESVRHLVNAGFNVLSVANNHILQHGRRAFEQTIELLRANGIMPVGVAGRDGANCVPARLPIAGVEFVFLGYAFECDKYYEGSPLYAQTDSAGIVSDIRRVKTPDNVVVCSFHWGREFVSYPSLEQIAVARAAVDAGCDLVLGHHPHVLNGFECYKGRYIFYSLGNFVFDQLWNEACTYSMAVRMEMSPSDVRFRGAESVRIGRDYCPRIVDDPEFETTLRQLCAQIDDTLVRGGDGYTRDANREEARNRYRSWWFMLRHLHQYDAVILRQIVAEAVKRRLGSDAHPVGRRDVLEQ